MSAGSEQIPYQPMNCQEPLGLASRFEALHLPFSPTRWLVRNFCSVVGVPPRVMSDRGHHNSVRGRVTPQLVRDDSPRFTAFALEKFSEELFRRAPIASGLYEDVDEITVLINRPPEILPLAADGDENLIEKPSVAESTSSLLQLGGVVRPELLAPLTDRFVRYDDSTFCK